MTLSRTLTPQSIRNYLSWVKMLHLFVWADYPFTKDFILSLTLRGVACKALHTPRQALPVTPSILLRISEVLSCDTDPLSLPLFCAFLFTFFLMSCLPNIAPSSFKSFDPRRNLTRGDIAVTVSSLLVTFKCTKTIQFGKCALRIPLLRIAISLLCPVAAYQRMVQLVPDRRSSPAFLIPGPAGLVPLTKRSFVSHFGSCLSSAGILNARSFRGHSFWRGVASWAFPCGVPGELIQQYGDWSSNAYFNLV